MASALVIAFSFTSLIALRGIEVDEFDNKVSGAARIWMADAKHAFRDAAGEILNEGVRQPECVEERLVAMLADESVPPDCTECTFGDVGELQVVAPPGHPELMAVRVAISIPHDYDSALYVFRREGEQWQLVFQREENHYETIGNALGSFDWKISPPAGDGSFLILTSAISPSLASNWQMLRYTVDRIVPWCDEPIAIARGESEIYIAWDGPELSLTPDHFGLRFGTNGLEPGFIRERWLEYDVVGDVPLRVDPIAGGEPEFLEEWLQMTPEEAMRWSDVEQPSLKGEYLEYGPMTQCVDGSWQLQINAFLNIETDNVKSTYFIVSEGEADHYRLREVRDEPRPGCEAAQSEETSPP